MDDVASKSAVFSQLDEVTQKKILEQRNIIFQGNITNLNELLAPLATLDLDDIIDSVVLHKLQNNEDVVVGRPVRPLDETTKYCYIPRKLRYLGYLNEAVYTKKKFSEICYNIKDTVTVGGAAGIGKSTFLTNFANAIKEEQPNFWVLKVDLVNYLKCFWEFKRNNVRSITLLDLINSRSESALTSNFEKKIFFISHKFIILLDGANEIPPDYKDLLLSLIDDCKQKCKIGNFAKEFTNLLVMTASTNLYEELGMILWNVLGPISQQEQIDFLEKYWEKKFLLNDAKKERCHVFAEAVTQWMERNGKDIEIPLLIRLVVEVLETGENFDDGVSSWKGFYEFISSDKAKPILPKKLSLPELYQLYIYKKCSENTKANLNTVRTDITEINKNCDFHLQILALETVFDRKRCDYFDCYKYKTKKIPEEKLKNCGIIDNTFNFTHKTFAEYFAAECISNELCRYQNEHFIEFLVRELLLLESYNIVRLFLDNFIEVDLKTTPKETFTTIGRHLKHTNYNYILYISAKQGLLQLLRLLFKCCQAVDIIVDANDIRIKGKHAIHCAAQSGFCHVVEYFLKNGICVDTRNDNDCTALHLAAEVGIFDMVKFLVEQGMKVNSKDKEGFTPLHKASKNGCLKSIRYLVEQGANVNSKSKHEVSALHIAVARGDVNAVEFLIERGAVINSMGKERGTVLSNAIHSGNFTVVRYLVQKGAHVMTRLKLGGTMLHSIPKWKSSINLQEIIKISKLLIERGVDINSVDSHGNTVLYTSIDKGYGIEFVKFLVERGASVDLSNTRNGTPLSNAISKNDAEIVEYLMESGAKLNEYNNQNIICDAVTHNRVDVIKLLTEKGVNLNVSNDEGLSTLGAAINGNNYEMVKLLVAKGVKITSDVFNYALKSCNLDIVKFLWENGNKSKVDFRKVFGEIDTSVVKYLLEMGCTFKLFKDVGRNLDLLKFLFHKGIAIDDKCIFFNATVTGHLEIVKLLLEKGIDVNVQGGQGNTAVHEAATCGHFHVAKLLVENGADVNIPNQYNCTALCNASAKGFLKVVKLLIDAGADVNTEVGAGDTALTVAALCCHLDVVKVLVEHGAKIDAKNDYFGTPLLIAFTRGSLDMADYLAEKDPEFQCTAVEVVKRVVADGNDYKLLDAIFTNISTVKYLKEKGLEVSSREINNHHLIIKAVEKNDFELVTYFIESGGDVYIKDNREHSTLHETTDLRMAKLLIRNGADVNAKTKESKSVLHVAIEKSNLDMCKFLVESGANVNEEDTNGSSLLHMRGYGYASISFDKIKYLVEKGAILTLTKNGRNVLHEAIASYHKDPELIAYFIELGAEVNSRDKNGVTPLVEAVVARDSDIVELLVQHGAEIDIGILFQAVKRNPHGGVEGDLDMVKYLVQKGANVNAKCKEGRTVLHESAAAKLLEVVKYLVEKGADVNAVDNNGCTVLHEASTTKDYSLMEYLVQKGAKLDGKTARGRTLLHEASSSGNFAFVKFLLENGADVSIGDRDGNTAIHEAMGKDAFFNANEYLNITKLLIENGALLNIQTRKGLTPLHKASFNMDLNKIQVLIENGADVNVRDEYGRTPLFSVVMRKENLFCRSKPDIVEFFVKSGGANLAEIADNGRTVLHEASILGDVDIVKVLIGLGADVNAKTRADRTPLHDAARRGMLDVVEFLVKSGAEIGTKTTQGLTAFDEAIKGEHTKVVEFLESYEKD